MKNVVALAALAAALASPVGVFAQDVPAPPSTAQPPQSLQPGQLYEIVEPATGRVIGNLIAVRTAPLSVRITPDRTKNGDEASSTQTDTRWHPHEQESAAFWNAFNNNFKSLP